MGPRGGEDQQVGGGGTRLTVLGQLLVDLPAPAVETFDALDYTPACTPCGGVETLTSAIGITYCADCGALIRRKDGEL